MKVVIEVWFAVHEEKRIHDKSLISKLPILMLTRRKNELYSHELEIRSVVKGELMQLSSAEKRNLFGKECKFQCLKAGIEKYKFPSLVFYLKFVLFNWKLFNHFVKLKLYTYIFLTISYQKLPDAPVLILGIVGLSCSRFFFIFIKSLLF